VGVGVVVVFDCVRVGEGVGVGLEEGAGWATKTPLFQIIFLPLLMQVKVLPWYFFVAPILLQGAPALGLFAANVAVREVVIRVRQISATLNFIVESIDKTKSELKRLSGITRP
jgi:hypothetical protein